MPSWGSAFPGLPLGGLGELGARLLRIFYKCPAYDRLKPVPVPMGRRMLSAPEALS